MKLGMLFMLPWGLYAPFKTVFFITLKALKLYSALYKIQKKSSLPQNAYNLDKYNFERISQNYHFEGVGEIFIPSLDGNWAFG